MEHNLKCVFYTYCGQAGRTIPDVFIACNYTQTYDDLVKIVKDCYKDSNTTILSILPEVKTEEQKYALQGYFQEMLGKTDPREKALVNNLMRCINSLSWSI